VPGLADAAPAGVGGHPAVPVDEGDLAHRLVLVLGE
jgi:hypothetical protein